MTRKRAQVSGFPRLLLCVVDDWPLGGVWVSRVGFEEPRLIIHALVDSAGARSLCATILLVQLARLPFLHVPVLQ